MEVSGVVFRSIPYFSGAGIDAHLRHSSVKLFSAGVSLEAGERFSGEIRNLGYRESRVPVKPRKLNGFSGSGLCDVGHVQYYSVSKPVVRCRGGKKEKHKEMKKKVKLLKGLSKNLSNFSEIGFGLDSGHDLADQVKGKMISEAAELLLKQLQQLLAEEKELKRKRKEEKAKLKAARIQNHEESSDTSSESSDGESGQVIDMSHLKAKVPTNPTENELYIQQPSLVQESTLTPSTTPTQERLSHTSSPTVESSDPCIDNCSNLNNADLNSQDSIPNGVLIRKIEVCTGGKCKKSGAALYWRNLKGWLAVKVRSWGASAWESVETGLM